MKTIVYHTDGVTVATDHADAIVSRGEARYATRKEVREYERWVTDTESRICTNDLLDNGDNLGDSPDY